VRRLTALAITIGLAWLLVARLGHESGSSAALALGVALVAAAIAGWLVEFLRLPRITGYLIVGLACGPSFANIITDPMARDLQAASRLAIVVIAVIAGLHLNVRRLQPRLRLIGALSLWTMAAAWVGLAAALYFAWPWLPIGGGLAGAPRFVAAAIAATLLAGASPAVTVAVIAESRARGPLADLATEVVVVMEVATIVLFTVWQDVARHAFGVPLPDVKGLVSAAAWTTIGSAAFGAFIGGAFTIYLRFIGREVTLLLLVVCAVITGLGTELDLDLLIAGVAAGVVVQNAAPQTGDVLRDAIEHGAMPVLVLFFAALGAGMHIAPLATVGSVAAAITVIRLVMLRSGVRVAQRVHGDRDQPEMRLLWRALIPTAGVTLALAATMTTEHPEWGVGLEAIVVAVVAINQLIGPILFRVALNEAHEIGASSAGLVVVSNREPWVHERAPGGAIRARPTPGGVSVALDALMRERGGVWIAHGAGSADREVVDESNSVEVPLDAPAYRLRRLWLTPELEERYYAGFSNSALWPLCHQAHVRPVFRAEDWEAYQQVNTLFAEAAAIEAPPDSSVFLNDYHLALVAGYLRARRPMLRTALFWHIPWPDVDRLRICPWRRELIAGLLSNDLLAFQLTRDRRHFLNAVIEEGEGSVSGDIVYRGDRAVRVVAIPIGADFDRITTILADEALPGEMQRMAASLSLEGRVVGIGVDRLDYTKGIPERIDAIDRLLAERPELASRFVFVQVGVPSRTDVPGYAEISEEISLLVAHVNEKYGASATDGPIRYVTAAYQLPELVALYRLASFCIVSSLHDGMNLVAKEFVAARDDLDGVLILSELAGAAQELDEALIINPYDERGFTAAIARAVEMPIWERRRRMQALRRRVAGRDVLAWASDILDRLERRKGTGFLSG